MREVSTEVRIEGGRETGKDGREMYIGKPAVSAEYQISLAS